MWYALPSAPYKQMTVSKVAQSTHVFYRLNDLNWFKPGLNVGVVDSNRFETFLFKVFITLGINTMMTVFASN